MTISKKLFMATIIAFGMHYAVPAYSYVTFNAAELKTEVSQILDGIQELRKHNSSEAKKAVKWLEKAMDGKRSISDTDVIIIAKTVSSQATTEAKVAVVLKVMANISDAQAKQEKNILKAQLKEKKHHLKSTEKWYIDQLREKAMVGCVGGVVLAAAVVGIYNDILAGIQRHDNRLLSQAQNMISHHHACNQEYLKQ